MHASFHEHTEIVKLLLAVDGIEVNTQNKVPNNCILFVDL